MQQAGNAGRVLLPVHVLVLLPVERFDMTTKSVDLGGLLHAADGASTKRFSVSVHCLDLSIFLRSHSRTLFVVGLSRLLTRYQSQHQPILIFLFLHL